MFVRTVRRQTLLQRSRIFARSAQDWALLDCRRIDRRLSEPQQRRISTSTMIVEEENRRYPLKRPKGHKVPVPRWTLKLPDDVTHVYTLYLGVQSHDRHTNASTAERSIEKWLGVDQERPLAVDTFRVTNGFDIVDSRVWVAYWTDSNSFNSRLQTLDLKRIWQDLGDKERQSNGLWCEHFETPVHRLETNYASLLHQPGIAQVPGGQFPEHNLTAYWGSGRDRIPGSKDDLFLPLDETPKPQSSPKGVGEHLVGKNYENMCHIRKSLLLLSTSICQNAHC